MSVVAAAVIGGSLLSYNSAKNQAKSNTAAAGQIADASTYAADLQYDLGEKELAFNKEQYEYAKGITDKVVGAQLDTMTETNRQAKDYYDYMVANQRPVEDALNAEAMAAGGAADQERAAAEAGADTQAGISNARASRERELASMGVNPNSGRFAAGEQSNTVMEGAALAGSKNTARTNAKNLGYAKKLDVSGLYRGLAGASQGAYSTALSAGNSAVGNTNSTANLGMSGLQSANRTTIGGANTALQGATSIAGILQQNPQAEMMAGIGGNLMGAGLYKWAG